MPNWPCALRRWLDAQNQDRFVASHGGVARALFYLLAGVKPETAASINIWQGRALWFTPGDGYRWVG